MHSHAPLVQQLQRRSAAKRDPQATSPAAAGGEHQPLSRRAARAASSSERWARTLPSLTIDESLAACSVYQSPAVGDTVVAYEAHNVTWDCSCIGTDVAGEFAKTRGSMRRGARIQCLRGAYNRPEIDITLYLVNGGALHGWQQ